MGNPKAEAVDMAAPLLASLYDREPMSAEGAKAEIHRWARVEARKYDTQWTVTPKQLGMMNGLLGKAFGDDDGGTVARHQFFEYVFGNPSSKGLTIAQASAVIDWLKDPDGPGPHPAAVAECWGIVKAWGLEHGQEEMTL